MVIRLEILQIQMFDTVIRVLDKHFQRTIHFQDNIK